MKVAIIIVTYNGSKYIARCLTSVFSNKYENFTVLVVDNNSADDTVEIVGKLFPQVELIKLDSNLGFVGGNNIGIKRALQDGADCIILLNQDTEVEYDWLAQLVKTAQENKKAGIIQAMLLLAEERSLTNNVGNAMHYLGFGFVKHYRERVDSWFHRSPFEIGYASGAAMLITREVLEKVGALDEKFFMYHEDLDLCWRARLTGYKIMIAPQAVVYHHYQFNRNKKMFYWTERNRWACLLQNYSWTTLLKLAPILILIEMMMLAYSLSGGWLVQKLKSYAWVIKYFKLIMRQRERVQLMRQLSDKEVMRHMDAKLEFTEVSNPVLKWIVSPIAEWYYKLIAS